MHDLFSLHITWKELLDPTHALINSVIRATVVYLFLFFVLRLMKNSRSGGLSVSDVLLVTLTGNAVQNGLIGEGNSLTEGAVSALTIFFWSQALDWIAFHVPSLRWLIESKPQIVIQDGEIVQRGLRRELLTEDGLRAQLRVQGVEDIANIKQACVEGNGSVSVILKRDK